MTHRPEALLERQVLKALGRDPALALFKNECGEGFYGTARHQILALPRTHGTVQLVDVLGALDRNRVHFGLHVGSADLVAVARVEITPQMVGRSIGRFVSIELKSATGRVGEAQQAWIDRMRELGATAGVARSPGDAAVLVEEAKR